MTERKTKQIGRLAMRHEGNSWNAYYAMPDSMDDAILLGSIAMRFIVANPERKQAFMDMMRAAVSELIEEMMGTKPEWPNGARPAPEHERAKHR